MAGVRTRVWASQRPTPLQVQYLLPGRWRDQKKPQQQASGMGVRRLSEAVLILSRCQHLLRRHRGEVGVCRGTEPGSSPRWSRSMDLPQKCLARLRRVLRPLPMPGYNPPPSRAVSLCSPRWVQGAGWVWWFQSWDAASSGCPSPRWATQGKERQRPRWGLQSEQLPDCSGEIISSSPTLFFFFKLKSVNKKA